MKPISLGNQLSEQERLIFMGKNCFDVESTINISSLFQELSSFLILLVI